MAIFVDTSESYVNHSLPDRPEFYRSIYLQKAHLRGESLSTVIFCMIHEIHTRLKYIETKLRNPMNDFPCSRPCKRDELKNKIIKKNTLLQRIGWSHSDMEKTEILGHLLDTILEY